MKNDEKNDARRTVLMRVLATDLLVANADGKPIIVKAKRKDKRAYRRMLKARAK